MHFSYRNKFKSAYDNICDYSCIEDCDSASNFKKLQISVAVTQQNQKEE